jgi:5'-nucleotidase
MTSPRILLTGDDGYQSPGTRLLAHVLKKKYDVTIAGTQSQQSGVGGKLSISTGFNWGKTEVDGVPAYWVDGTPVDAMELMAARQDFFDLVISGINWGGNFGSAIMNSGTVNAAIAAFTRGVAPHSIAISWDLPPEFYTMNHQKNQQLDEYFDYPGAAIAQLLDRTIEAKLWGAQFLNINLPQRKTEKVKVTRLTKSVNEAYEQLPPPQEGGGHYSFAGNGRVFSKSIDPVYDVRAVTDGFISLSPCQLNLLHDEAFQNLQNVDLTLQVKNLNEAS